MFRCPGDVAKQMPRFIEFLLIFSVYSMVVGLGFKGQGAAGQGASIQGIQGGGESEGAEGAAGSIQRGQGQGG